MPAGNQRDHAHDSSRPDPGCPLRPTHSRHPCPRDAGRARGRFQALTPKPTPLAAISAPLGQSGRLATWPDRTNRSESPYRRVQAPGRDRRRSRGAPKALSRPGAGTCPAPRGGLGAGGVARHCRTLLLQGRSAVDAPPRVRGVGHSAVPSTAWGRAVGAAPGWARGDRRGPDKRDYQAAPNGPADAPAAYQAAPLAARSPPTWPAVPTRPPRSRRTRGPPGGRTWT